MFHKTKVNRAVVAVMTATIAASTAGLVTAEGMLEEIVVTATKKSASMQDIPIAVQAMTEETLEEQNVTSF